MSRPCVLLVDNDSEGVERLRTFLGDFGYEVLVAQDRESVLAMLGQQRPDVVVMDVMLTRANGLALLQEIRAEARIPVVVVSRRTETADRIVGLELGADDYMCKPFEPRELLARLRAIMRRLPERHVRPTAPMRGVQLGRWELRRDERRLVAGDDETVALSASEYRLLNAFLAAPRMVLSRQHLMSTARGRELHSLDRGIDLLVSRLRRKLEDDVAVAPLIRTVRGRGYIFEPPNDAGSLQRSHDWSVAVPDAFTAPQRFTTSAVGISA
jgi:two-component system OmpR family response regulator